MFALPGGLRHVFKVFPRFALGWGSAPKHQPAAGAAFFGWGQKFAFGSPEAIALNGLTRAIVPGVTHKTSLICWCWFFLLRFLKPLG